MGDQFQQQAGNLLADIGNKNTRIGIHKLCAYLRAVRSKTYGGQCGSAHDSSTNCRCRTRDNGVAPWSTYVIGQPAKQQSNQPITDNQKTQDEPAGQPTSQRTNTQPIWEQASKHTRKHASRHARRHARRRTCKQASNHASKHASMHACQRAGKHAIPKWRRRCLNGGGLHNPLSQMGSSLAMTYSPSDTPLKFNVAGNMPRGKTIQKMKNKQPPPTKGSPIESRKIRDESREIKRNRETSRFSVPQNAKFKKIEKFREPKPQTSAYMHQLKQTVSSNLQTPTETFRSKIGTPQWGWYPLIDKFRVKLGLKARPCEACLSQKWLRVGSHQKTKETRFGTS